MAKKVLALLVLAFIVILGFGAYGAFKYRAQQRKQRQEAKAPQTSVTLLEGWTNQDIANYLQKNGIANSADFLSAAKTFNPSQYPLLADKPHGSDLEGFIFPDTYFVPKIAPVGQGISQIIISKALDNLENKFTPQMRQQATARGMDVFKILTLASIIESETGRSAATADAKIALDAERKVVAGIFYNRLAQGMPLQSDATVNFITGKSAASVSDADTQIDSPYNTYKYPGLPPGPICNPSLSSIMAALYPEQTDYLYFLTDPATGRAVYAKTYEEHLKNKAEYLK